MSFLKPAEFRDGIWLNPIPTEVGATRHLPKVLRKFLTNREECVPKAVIGPFHTDPAVFRVPPASGLRVTLLGHSSLLLEVDGTTVLIDPVFSERASMVQWFGPKRFFPPPLRIEDLPPVDAVVLTHDHYDHLDSEAIRRIDQRTPEFVCSMGVGSHLQRWGISGSKIHEMNWMDSHTVPSSSTTPLTLTALPARHFSGRGLKRYATLWSSFLLHTDRHHIYHGADSGYYAGFQEIGEMFGPFDLAMLEVGAFDPLWNQIHLGPDNAMQAALDLRTKMLMPIHWGTFNLAFHAWYQPAERITELARQQGMPLFLPEPGTPLEFTGKEANSFWWRRYLSAAASRGEKDVDGTGEGSSAAATVARA